MVQSVWSEEAGSSDVGLLLFRSGLLTWNGQKARIKIQPAVFPVIPLDRRQTVPTESRSQ